MRATSKEWPAVLTLALAMGAHQIAETACDALFLRELGPTRLPFVYLILAAVGIPIALVPSRFSSKRPWLAKLLLANAAAAGGFWWMSGQGWPWIYEALYVWTGLSAAVFVTFFWLFASRRHSVSRAKQVFPKIALGGIAGALGGAAIARVLTEITETRELLLASMLVALLASAVATRLERHAGEPSETKERRAPSLADMIHRSIRAPYARMVGAVLLLAALTFTLLDYTFKSMVAEHVPKQELGSLFATFYLALNLASLLSQALFVKRLLLWVGLTTVMLLLPTLIVLGAGSLLLGGGLAAALLLKGADGSLRYSLHRTSTELLFVPMQESTRSVVKPLLDIAVKPAGQALASLLILLFLGLSARNSVYAGMTIALGSLWIVAGIRLRRHYLDVFRKTLRADAIDLSVELPELELESLAQVVGQLNDENDGAVNGAVRTLAAHGHAALIPDLVLYHPSAEVVTHALRVFREERRTRVHPLAHRLLANSSPEVRAEALLFCVATEPALECPPGAARDPDPLVRGVAAALLLDEGASEMEVRRQLGSEESSERFQIGFASAIAYLPERARRCLSPALVAQTSGVVQGKIAEALATEPLPREVPLFLHFLSVRQAREHARRALSLLGSAALESLVRALNRASTPLAIRCHVPRTISRFSPHEAAPILLHCVASETDELVLHKALRGLGRIMATHPEARLDRKLVMSTCEQMISRTLLLLLIRSTLQAVRIDERGAIEATLIALLREAENRSLEHVFRMLHILHPGEGLDGMFRGITGRSARRRSSAEELLSHVVDWRLRNGVLALTMDAPDEERLASAASDYELQPLDELGALERLLDDGGPLGHAARRYLEAFGIERAEREPAA